jgi:hypothetical protein
MMDGRLPIAALTLIMTPLLNVPAVGAVEEPASAEATGAASTWTYGNRVISYHISAEQLAKTPKWSDPSHGKPPLSLGRAVDVSKQELPRYVPEVSNWDLRSIALTRFAEVDRWYYLVTWQASGLGVDHQLSIPVLMNGASVTLKWFDDKK